MKWVKQDGEEEEQWRIGLPDTRRATFVKSPLLILCLSLKESPSLIIHIITTTLSPLTALSLSIYIYIPTQLNVLLICDALQFDSHEDLSVHQPQQQMTNDTLWLRLFCQLPMSRWLLQTQIDTDTDQRKIAERR